MTMNTKPAPVAETFTEVKQHRQHLQTLLAELAKHNVAVARDPRVAEALKLGRY